MVGVLVIQWTKRPKAIHATRSRTHWPVAFHDEVGEGSFNAYAPTRPMPINEPVQSNSAMSATRTERAVSTHEVILAKETNKEALMWVESGVSH